MSTPRSTGRRRAATPGQHAGRDIDLALSDLATKLNPAIAAAAPQRSVSRARCRLRRGLDQHGACSRPGPTPRSLPAIFRRPSCGSPESGSRAIRFECSSATPKPSPASEGPFDLIYLASRGDVLRRSGDGISQFADCGQRRCVLGLLLLSRLGVPTLGLPSLHPRRLADTLPPPGREPSGFAFAEPEYVREILSSAGLDRRRMPCPVPFRYVAAGGEQARSSRPLSFLGEIGPASRSVTNCRSGERTARCTDAGRHRAPFQRRYCRIRRLRMDLVRQGRGRLLDARAAARNGRVKQG